MGALFTRLRTVPALDDLLADTTRQPVVLFQHDPYCGLSRRAYAEVAQLPYQVMLVDVAQDHAVKDAIAARTGIRHESPQVIVLRQGAVVWAASHGAIRQRAIAQAVAAGRAPGDVGT